MIDTSRISLILNGSDPMINTFKRSIFRLLIKLDLPFNSNVGSMMVDIGDENQLIIIFYYTSKIEAFLRKDGIHREDLWQKFYGYDDVAEMVEDIVWLKDSPPVEESKEEKE